MAFTVKLKSILDNLDQQLSSLDKTRREMVSIVKILEKEPAGITVDILRLKEFVRQEPELSGGINAMRWQIQQERQSLLESGSLVLRGNRILINRPKYIRYLTVTAAGGSKNER